jgi:hypothetical protein
MVPLDLASDWLKLMTNHVDPTSKIPLAYICYIVSHTGFGLLICSSEKIFERADDLTATAI